MSARESDWLFDGPSGADTLLILAHGAGAPMDSPFMEEIAREIGDRGVRVARFEFAYMAARREGRRRPPDREKVLLKRWCDVVAALRKDNKRVFIGGKSMGGRIATMVADSIGVTGVVCLGYPFHPPGKPEKTRTSHLETLITPALFVQGTRDALGSRQDVGGYTLSPSIEMFWIEDGDHSLKPRKSSGRTLDENMAEAIERVGHFLSEA